METFILICALIPAVLFAWNVFLFRSPRGQSHARISVLIPARNEAASIGRSVQSVLDSRHVDVEVLVFDDGSEDDTAAIVQAISARDARVRLMSGPSLPEGWNGKQHACHVLAQNATHDLLCFLDADVRLEPDALSRVAAFLEESRSGLVSGFPRQETVSFLERLLIPLVHFVLLGYLPMILLRHTSHPGFAAGCGQLIMVRRTAYWLSGGHAAIRQTMHDGIRLPAAFRRAGCRTDIFDATQVATCRMYSDARGVWDGLAKNAVEGMASPGRIFIFTGLLLFGQVLPFVCVSGSAVCVSAVLLALAQRVIAAIRYRQPLGSAFLHPVGVGLLLVIQWYALIRHLLHRPAVWKGRSYLGQATGS